MANEELLGVLGGNDLSAFTQSVLRTDPYGLAATSLASWRPDPSTWSPKTTAATAFGQAFLSGLLGRYAQQNAADQTNKIIAVMPQLRADPMSVMAPEGVDEGAFANLKASAVLRNQLASAQREQTLAELMQKVGIAGLTKKAEVLGENAAYQEMGDAEEIPGSPAYKARQDDIKFAQDQVGIERQLSNDFMTRAAEFKYKEQGLKALAKAYLDPAGTSDFEIIRRGAQAVEPGLAVRADDEASLQGAASVLGMSYEAIKAAIAGKSKLTPDVRAGIMRIAKRSYESSLDDYNTIRNTFVQRARAAKLDESLVVPYGMGRPFEELYPDLDISGTSAVAPPEVPPGMKLQRNKVTGETRLVPQ